MNGKDFAYINTPLPDDIAALKGMGRMQEALRRIDARLRGSLSPALRARLELEKALLPQYEEVYRLSVDDLLAAIRAHIPDFSKDDLAALDEEGWLDSIAINGAPRYLYCTVDSLLKAHPAFARRAGAPLASQNPVLDPVIARMKAQGSVSVDIELCARLRIRDNAFAPGPYRVHLPLAKPSMSQHGIRLLDASPAPCQAAGPDAPQRTAYFAATLRENAPFTLRFAYTQTARYADLWSPMPPRVLYPDAPAPTPDDLASFAPHLAFTPYLDSLAHTITQNDASPLAKARSIYLWITENVRYAYQRPYRLTPHGAEYAAVNRRGDCGLQALLFIVLCRILSIPARWESGLYAGPDHVGSHDWAQFYTGEYGWLPVDCSFGGAGFRQQNPERRAFYFGNLDPYRMVANSRYFSSFTPDTQFLRNDPYDNQSGEAETPVRPLASWEYDTKWSVVRIAERNRH